MNKKLDFFLLLVNNEIISGLPQSQETWLWLKILSKSTGFSFQPLNNALGSSYNPDTIAMFPGLDSVGTRVWEIPCAPWFWTELWIT